MPDNGDSDDQRQSNEIDSSLLIDLQESFLVEEAKAEQGLSVVRESLLEPGTTIDNYSVIRPLGSGGMARVYLARDIKLGRNVALKVIRADQLKGKDAIEHFLFEARTTAKFNHPHIVTVYSVGEYQGSPYLALEYVEGQTLREKMATERLTQKSAVRIGLAISLALDAAHSQELLHLDIKPENVLLGKDGVIRLADFGLAAFIGQEEKHEPTDLKKTQDLYVTLRGIKGTPQYMAPEQWLDKDVGPWSDIWALGLTLFEMNTNQHPFMNIKDNLSLRAAIVDSQQAVVLPDCRGQPDWKLIQMLKRCLSKQKHQRPQAKEVVSILAQFLRKFRKTPIAQSSIHKLPTPKKPTHPSFKRSKKIAAPVKQPHKQPSRFLFGPFGLGKSTFIKTGVIISRINPYLFLFVLFLLFISSAWIWSMIFDKKPEATTGNHFENTSKLIDKNILARSVPTGAKVLIEDRLIGTTDQNGVALSIEPGKEKYIVFRKSNHLDYKLKVIGPYVGQQTIEAKLIKSDSVSSEKPLQNDISHTETETRPSRNIKATLMREKHYKNRKNISKKKTKKPTKQNMRNDLPSKEKPVPLIDDDMDLLPVRPVIQNNRPKNKDMNQPEPLPALDD